MNNGTLERELLNRDRKNSRISAFQPESSLRVVRFVRDERATIPLFTRPSSTTRNDSSSSRRISSPCLVYLPLSSSLCELFINVGESMRPCWILDATAIQSSRKRGEGEAAFSTSCCYSLAFYAVDFMVFPYHPPVFILLFLCHSFAVVSFSSLSTLLSFHWSSSFFHVFPLLLYSCNSSLSRCLLFIQLRFYIFILLEFVSLFSHWSSYCCDYFLVAFV